MKNKNVKYFRFAFIIASICFVGACDDNNYLLPSDNLKSGNPNADVYVPDCSFITTSSIDLTDIEKEMLLFVREEEKMAHDVYEYLAGKCNSQIFEKIRDSEAIHMEKVLCLIIHFNLDDPASTETGEFTNPVIQEMYNDLITLGSGSITDALTAGAIIEDFDINDINNWILLADTDPIVQVFKNLVCGSENHLISFTDKLKSFGITYTPTCITQEEFDDIIIAGQQKCGF